MKLHETLDIEFRVIKEQVRRLEERVEHLESTGRS
jgi:chaperonin cofactor prefoldin